MSFVSATGLYRRFDLGSGLFARRALWAVAGVSLELSRGTTLGLVGESGCGKSTVGQLLLGLLSPTRGTVRLDGVDVTATRGEALRRLRRRMQLVFQDPSAALNPRVPVAEAVAEPLRAHWPALATAERGARVAAMLERVGLSPALGARLPQALSGGQRQRVVIARALVAEPDFVVADEPVSALDVSVQAQIVNLLADLRRERALTMLFISHDLRVVEHLADEVAVMYLGRVVEQAPARALFSSPLHPYTQALASAVPDPRPGRRAPVLLEGEVPSPLEPPTGCAFHPRCPLRARLSKEQQARCGAELPSLRPAGASGQRVACHHAEGA